MVDLVGRKWIVGIGLVDLVYIYIYIGGLSFVDLVQLLV